MAAKPSSLPAMSMASCVQTHLRGKKNRVKSILHCDRFAKLNVDAGISRNGFADSMFAEGNGVGHLLVSMISRAVRILVMLAG